MPITTACAVIPSADLTAARDWWTQRLGREPDRVPMPSGLGWLFPAGWGLQLVGGAEHAGAGAVALRADDLDGGDA